MLKAFDFVTYESPIKYKSNGYWENARFSQVFLRNKEIADSSPKKKVESVIWQYTGQCVLLIELGAYNRGRCETNLHYVGLIPPQLSHAPPFKLSTNLYITKIQLQPSISPKLSLYQYYITVLYDHAYYFGR